MQSVWFQRYVTQLLLDQKSAKPIYESNVTTADIQCSLIRAGNLQTVEPTAAIHSFQAVS